MLVLRELCHYIIKMIYMMWNFTTVFNCDHAKESHLSVIVSHIFKFSFSIFNICVYFQTSVISILLNIDKYKLASIDVRLVLCLFAFFIYVTPLSNLLT